MFAALPVAGQSFSHHVARGPFERGFVDLVPDLTLLDKAE